MANYNDKDFFGPTAYAGNTGQTRGDLRCKDVKEKEEKKDILFNGLFC